MYTITMQAHVSVVMESSSTLHSSLDSLAATGVSQPASQWTRDAASLSTAIGEFADSQRSGIAAVGKMVSDYITEEISVDIPTGSVTLFLVCSDTLAHVEERL